jgi:hypothetical protein
VVGFLGEALERLEGGRRQEILRLLAAGSMTQPELRRHFRFPLTVGWHLRELHALGLIAYNRRAGRYHLVRPALEELAAFCAEVADLAGRSEAADGPRQSHPSSSGSSAAQSAAKAA